MEMDDATEPASSAEVRGMKKTQKKTKGEEKRRRRRKRRAMTG